MNNLQLLKLFKNKNLIKSSDFALLEQNIIDSGKTVTEYLVSQKYCTELEALPVLAEFYNMPYSQVDMLEVDNALLNSFKLSFLKRKKILPVKVVNNKLLVAIANPADMQIYSSTNLLNYKTEYILAPTSQILTYINSVTAKISAEKALDDLSLTNAPSAEQKSIDESFDDAINNPTVRLVDSIIREAIPLRASDIHIEPFEHFVKVRYRIDGDLLERAEFPIESYSSICARLKIMSGINIAERRIPQDGRISLKIGELEYDLRLSTLPTVHGEKFVIRILDKTTFGFSRKDLGFTEQENAVVDKILSHSHGIVLLTGPTGCGKSTTLYSFIKEIAKPSLNVITVEDPVEYSMPGINQVQVNNKANLSFATVLKSILRQDPDIIMVGEIRDEETAEIAVRAAITGHLVLSTLHTNDATGAIIRLEDMKISDYLVADALKGVIAQRLVKILCPNCKKQDNATKAELNLLGLENSTKIYRACGCRFCSYTGYKGRQAVHEIMYMSESMRHGVTKGKSNEDLKKIAISEGMVTLWDSCKSLVLQGITDINELTGLFCD
ncbi:MAG: type II/IV secretion system protein [Clostridiales bacterium]|nr:type II/IV secretion system protein [Clostridiales bacterium]